VRIFAAGATAAEAVVGYLAGRGVRRFYTVPGESFLEILDAVERHPDLSLVSCRHESGAAFMAEADGQLTGVPAVALATRAVGAANLAIGVFTAREASTPMLVLLGQVETSALGRHAFQEIDLPRFYAELTVHAETVHQPGRAVEAVARAYRHATSGRRGPAMVAFPADVLTGPGDAEPPPGTDVVPVRPDEAALAGIETALRRARRPVAVLGGGARPARAGVVALAERFGLGVYSGFRRQDVFPNSHPQYLGHLTVNPPRELLEPLERADAVLVLGARLGEITTQGYALPRPGVPVVQVDVDPDALGATVPAAWAVPAPVDTFAAALLARPGEPVRRDWSAAHGRYLELSTPDVHHDGPAVHPAQVVAAMARHLPRDVVLTNDAGNFSQFCHRYWRFDHPRTQLGPSSGAMGYAVPAAVGAQLAAPDRRVVALVGDGGFLMTGNELETAVRHRAPVLAVVFQNRLYGTIAMHQARQLGRVAGVDIGDVDLAGFARSLGADAVEVSRPADLDAAFARAAAFDRPRAVVVRTDPDVLTPTTTLSGLLSS
jgi:acetolactate synthase-1/2/3 large subunit